MSSAAVSTLDALRDVDTTSLLVLAFGLVCVAIPLELGQLSFALVGAIAYALVQSIRSSTKDKVAKKIKVAPAVPRSSSETLSNEGHKINCSISKRGSQREQGYDRASRQHQRQVRDYSNRKKEPKVDYRQPSAKPVTAPTFTSNDFNAQVTELLQQIAPSQQGDEVMKKLAAAATQILQKMIPEAEVLAFASADIMRGTAFGVAVPEVDLICNATPDVLAKFLQNRAARPIPHATQLDARKLSKSSLRACTDELVAGGVFKFRRSAFKGLEPKVTLLATGFGAGDISIPVDFSVNSLTPLHNAALLTECGHIDLRARDLILLVRRWAKDRGVSHAAKGHLSPYAWSLLAIYFLQVWSQTEGQQPMLPTLSAFKISSGLLRAQQAAPKQHQQEHQQKSTSDVSVASIFKSFMLFFSQTIDWRREAVSVRAGKRQAPAQRLPLHILEIGNGSTEVAPSIEDPFEPTRNLSMLMTANSYLRFREELLRAHNLCSRDASLGEILEPWVPPERGNAGNDEEGFDSAGEQQF
jgi:hypothetical protein